MDVEQYSFCDFIGSRGSNDSSSDGSNDSSSDGLNDNSSGTSSVCSSESSSGCSSVCSSDECCDFHINDVKYAELFRVTIKDYQRFLNWIATINKVNVEGIEFDHLKKYELFLQKKQNLLAYNIKREKTRAIKAIKKAKYAKIKAEKEQMIEIENYIEERYRRDLRSNKKNASRLSIESAKFRIEWEAYENSEEYREQLRSDRAHSEDDDY